MTTPLLIQEPTKGPGDLPLLRGRLSALDGIGLQRAGPCHGGGRCAGQPGGYLRQGGDKGGRPRVEAPWEEHGERPGTA